MLFTIRRRLASSVDESQVAVLDLQTKTSKVLFTGGSDARYIQTGHFKLCLRGDVARRAVRPRTSGGRRSRCAGARGGGDDERGDCRRRCGRQRLTRLHHRCRRRKRAANSRDRRSTGTRNPPAARTSSRHLSTCRSYSRRPCSLSNWSDVSVYSFARATLTRLTTDQGVDRSPLWTSDSQRIVFTSMRAGHPELFGAPQMALVGTSGSSRVRRTSSICVPMAGPQIVNNCCLQRCLRLFWT